MKVDRIPGKEFVNFGSIKVGEAFISAGTPYIKARPSCDSGYFGVSLISGYSIYPCDLMPVTKGNFKAVEE